MSIGDEFHKLVKRSGEFISDNGSAITLGLGVAGLITAVIVTYIEAPKAEEAIEREKEEIMYEEAEEGVEKAPAEVIWREIKAAAPYMWPTVVLTLTGTACVIGGFTGEKRQSAAFATAYELSEAARRDYVQKVKEKIGEKAESEIQDEIYREKTKKTMPKDALDTAIISTGHGDQLFCDGGTGRFFRASTNYLEKVRIELSGRVFLNGFESQNELAYLLNMQSTALGNLAGWNEEDLDRSTKLLDMRWDRCYMTEWGEAFAVLEYPVNERYRAKS